MGILYKPVLIESAEQAEALPVGTVAIDLDSQGQQRQASIRVRCGWYCTGEVEADGSPWLAPHDAMAGDTALVPIEDEYGKRYDTTGTDETPLFKVGPTGRGQPPEGRDWASHGVVCSTCDDGGCPDCTDPIN